MEKRRNLFLLLVVVVTAILAGHAWAQSEVTTNDDMWIRESNGNVYENDGISIWSTGRNDERVGYLGFDLSGLSGDLGGVTLEVWEDPTLGSGANYPAKTTGYIVSAKPTSWANWQTLKTSAIQLDTLGAFDVDAVGGENPKRFTSSTGNASDIAEVQAAIGGTLHMVIECVEDGTTYSLDLADLEWGD